MGPQSPAGAGFQPSTATARLSDLVNLLSDPYPDVLPGRVEIIRESTAFICCKVNALLRGKRLAQCLTQKELLC